MGITELANALDLNKSTVCRFVQKGMPVTSVDAANAWRMVHAKPKKPLTQYKLVPPVVQNTDFPPPETDIEKEDPRQSLKRARQSERVGFNEIVKCQKNGGSVEDYRKAMSVFISAQNNLTKAQRDFREWQHAEKITLFYEEARELVSRPHVAVKQTLDIMPKTLAPRLYNQPQKAIEQTLAEWVDNLTALIRAEI